MSDNSPKQKLAGIKQAWSNPKARKGMLLGGGILIIVAMVAVNMAGKQKPAKLAPSGTASVAPPPGGQRVVTAETNDTYKDLVKDLDKERAQSAEANPVTMVLPSISGLTNDDAKRKAEEAAEKGRQAALKQGKENQENEFQTISQAAGMTTKSTLVEDQKLMYEAARNTPEYKATQGFMQSMISPTVQGAFLPIRPPAARTVNGSASTEQASGGAPAAVSGNQSNKGFAADLVNEPIIRAGEIVFATLDTAINSDFSGPVAATIRQGKYSGYRLVGRKSLEQEAVVVQFTIVTPPGGGGQFAASAYAVSLGDAMQFGVTGLEGVKDRHIFQRYILPAAAAFTNSYGLSASQKGYSTTTSSTGAISQSAPGLDNKDRVQIALGAAMAPLMADVMKQAARPVTIKLAAQSEIGIMFATDVVATSAAQAASVAGTNQAGNFYNGDGAAPRANTNQYGQPNPYGQMNPYQQNNMGGGFGAQYPGYGAQQYPGNAQGAYPGFQTPGINNPGFGGYRPY